MGVKIIFLIQIVSFKIVPAVKPVAFFVIYAERDYTAFLSPQAGSDELISFIDEFKTKRIVNLEGQQYMKIREWKGRGSTLRLGWYVNWTKHNDTTQPNHYLSTDIWRQDINDHTVELVFDMPSFLSGIAALSSSSASDAFLSGIAADPSRNSFNDFMKALEPINGLTLDGNALKIDKSTKLYQKSGAVIIHGNRFGNRGFMISLRKDNNDPLSDDEAINVGMEKNYQITPRDKIREFLVNLVNQTF